MAANNHQYGLYFTFEVCICIGHYGLVSNRQFSLLLSTFNIAFLYPQLIPNSLFVYVRAISNSPSVISISCSYRGCFAIVELENEWFIIIIFLSVFLFGKVRQIYLKNRLYSIKSHRRPTPRLGLYPQEGWVFLSLIRTWGSIIGCQTWKTKQQLFKLVYLQIHLGLHIYTINTY